MHLRAVGVVYCTTVGGLVGRYLSSPSRGGWGDPRGRGKKEGQWACWLMPRCCVCCTGMLCLLCRELRGASLSPWDILFSLDLFIFYFFLGGEGERLYILYAGSSWLHVLYKGTTILFVMPPGGRHCFFLILRASASQQSKFCAILPFWSR